MTVITYKPKIVTVKWVTVRCSECGKVLCEVLPGSTVKIKCRSCKAERVTTAA